LQEVRKSLLKSEQASIVLFSSVAASLGFPFHTQVSISKGAIEALAKTLAAELAPKVRVNVVAPSITLTPLSEHLLNNEKKIENTIARHPLKKIGDVNDIANMVSFLIDDKSQWITGQTLKVDGGISNLKI
jgi:3-oxoacyl-[acyl-carrier protein] reductase